MNNTNKGWVALTAIVLGIVLVAAIAIWSGWTMVASQDHTQGDRVLIQHHLPGGTVDYHGRNVTRGVNSVTFLDEDDTTVTIYGNITVRAH